MSGLRIGLLGASRIADEALVRPAARTEERLVAVAARLVDVVASGGIGEVTAVETRMRMPAPPPDDVRWSLASPAAR